MRSHAPPCPPAGTGPFGLNSLSFASTPTAGSSPSSSSSSSPSRGGLSDMAACGRGVLVCARECGMCSKSLYGVRRARSSLVSKEQWAKRARTWQGRSRRALIYNTTPLQQLRTGSARLNAERQTASVTRNKPAARAQNSQRATGESSKQSLVARHDGLPSGQHLVSATANTVVAPCADPP